MIAYGQDSLEGTGWRIGVDDAFLDQPGAPSRCCRSPTERQGSVLVPHYEPVRMMRLLEQRRVERPRIGSQNCPCDCEQPGLLGQIGECWISQGVAHASPTASQGTLSQESSR